MKKLITIFCATCISVGVIAQSGVRIGNYEFYVKKAESDSVTKVFVEEEESRPSNLSQNETRPQNSFKQYYTSTFFWGLGFILPDNSSDYYTTLGGKSINFDAGWVHRYHLTRKFALGGTFQYSYYNYRLRDAATEPFFVDEVIGREFVRTKIKKQVYRNHNVSAGAFTRFYLVPPKNSGNDGLYIDLGAQGDFAFRKLYKIKTQSERKNKYFNDYAFNPFTASAVARIGWSRREWNIFNVNISDNWDWKCCKSRAIFVRYRFTDAFNPKALPMDLPPITIGIQFF